MPLSNLAQLLQALLTNSLSSFSAYITDTSGTNHGASVYIYTASSSSITILVVDNSSATYTASSLTLQWTTSSNTTIVILTETVSGTKSSETPFVVTVTISASIDGVPSWLTIEYLYLFGGVVLSKSYSVTPNITIIQYSSSSSGCLSSVSSSSSTSGSVSYSPSGSTLYINVSASLGSCQQAQIQYITIKDGLGNSFQVDCTSNCTSSECGYNASCTAQFQMTVSA